MERQSFYCIIARHQYFCIIIYDKILLRFTISYYLIFLLTITSWKSNVCVLYFVLVWITCILYFEPNFCIKSISCNAGKLSFVFVVLVIWQGDLNVVSKQKTNLNYSTWYIYFLVLLFIFWHVFSFTYLL